MRKSNVATIGLANISVCLFGGVWYGLEYTQHAKVEHSIDQTRDEDNHSLIQPGAKLVGPILERFGPPPCGIRGIRGSYSRGEYHACAVPVRHKRWRLF